MPIYSYSCNTCLKSFEIKHSIHDEPKKECPECGTLSLLRVLPSSIAVNFKGKDFYCNEYKTLQSQQTSQNSSTTPPCGGSCSCH